MSQSRNVRGAGASGTSPYRIKRARTADERKAIARLDSQCFARDVEPPKLESSIAWIAVHIPTGTIVGYALGRPVPNEKQFYLARAGVALAHRGQGLQRRLIRARQVYARRRGLGCITYTVRWNPKSVNNLIACGFRYYEPENAWGGRDMLYWYCGKGALHD